MEDANKDGGNYTSINHVGWKAPVDYYSNDTDMTMTHYYDSDRWTDSYGLDICFDVLIHTWGHAWGNEMKWKINGYETNTSCESNAVYVDGYSYKQQCCLPTRENEFNLTCFDTFGDGWNSANIEIEGRYYCQNFKGDQMTVIVPNPAKQRCENGKNKKMYPSFVL